MSDTIQTVRWSLGANQERVGDLWLPSGREEPNDLLWDSIRSTGLEQRLKEVFEITDPVWYGLWISSPLTREQCQLLETLIAHLATCAPRHSPRLREFLEALRVAQITGQPLNVELTPPGHIDMGWITTFVHCPRCKAEGPVERWVESYPTEPISCPVCGHCYSPAATHSMEREFFAESVRCTSCERLYRVKDFSQDEIQLLENRHYYREFVNELVWLRRVEEFYRRYPDLEGKIKPHFLKVFESADPTVHEEVSAGVPFDEIVLPANTNPLEDSRPWSAEDLAVIEHLRGHYFSLPIRLTFVQESLARLEPIVARASVVCYACGGTLE